MCYWVFGFAFGLLPLSLTVLYHALSVLSSPIFEPLKRENVKNQKLEFSGFPKPSCFPVFGVFRLNWPYFNALSAICQYALSENVAHATNGFLLYIALYYNSLIRENWMI